MTRPWTIPVHLQKGELFSTWLARAALAQGCDPIHLTGALWPSWRAWTIDLDRGLSAERLGVLVARSGLSEAVLESSTLRPLLALVAPGSSPGLANWPWVLSQGSRNRRRYGGLQFCPGCLAEDRTPYFRRAWRLAWHIGCERHGGRLVDHCDSCHAPVEPHRSGAENRTLCCCPSCGFDLRRAGSKPACLEALAFQATADRVLHDGVGTWLGSTVSREAWFAMADSCAKGCIRVRAGDEVPEGITSLAINLQRPIERTLRLQMASRAMLGQSRGSSLTRRMAATRLTAFKRSGAEARGRGAGELPLPRPRAKVQGEWIRLLRRMRVGHP